MFKANEVASTVVLSSISSNQDSRVIFADQSPFTTVSLRDKVAGK